MTSSATPSATSAPPSDAAAAFDRMRLTLAGQTAAIEGFAARQQELHARDYTPDLAKIRDMVEALRGTINELSRRPGVALTPEVIAAQIAAAGSSVRTFDHQAWVDARREQRQAAHELRSVTVSARTAQVQRQWTGGAALAGLVSGIILTAIVPGAVDRSVPASWHWPERRAANIMRTDAWSAGQRLMQMANPTGWLALKVAATLSADNADALTACRKRAAKVKKQVRCTVQVRGASAG